MGGFGVVRGTDGDTYAMEIRDPRKATLLTISSVWQGLSVGIS